MIVAQGEFVQVAKAFVLTVALTFWAVGTIAALIGKFRYNIEQVDLDKHYAGNR